MKTFYYKGFFVIKFLLCFLVSSSIFAMNDGVRNVHEAMVSFALHGPVGRISCIIANDGRAFETGIHDGDRLMIMRQVGYNFYFVHRECPHVNFGISVQFYGGLAKETYSELQRLHAEQKDHN